MENAETALLRQPRRTGKALWVKEGIHSETKL